MNTSTPRAPACAALFITGFSQPAFAADQAVLAEVSLNPIADLVTTFGVNSESTYGWKNELWSVPVNFLPSPYGWALAI